jgi:excisionase family DNA binding protein
MKDDLKTSELLTIEQVAKILNLSKETLRRWDRSGKLTAIRIGSRGDRRYRKIDIIDFVADENTNKKIKVK